MCPRRQTWIGTRTSIRLMIEAPDGGCHVKGRTVLRTDVLVGEVALRPPLPPSRTNSFAPGYSMRTAVPAAVTMSMLPLVPTVS